MKLPQQYKLGFRSGLAPSLRMNLSYCHSLSGLEFRLPLNKQDVKYATAPDLRVVVLIIQNLFDSLCSGGSKIAEYNILMAWSNH
jgi:hypothetical protein